MGSVYNHQTLFPSIIIHSYIYISISYIFLFHQHDRACKYNIFDICRSTVVVIVKSLGLKSDEEEEVEKIK